MVLVFKRGRAAHRGSTSNYCMVTAGANAGTIQTAGRSTAGALARSRQLGSAHAAPLIVEMVTN